MLLIPIAVAVFPAPVLLLLPKTTDPEVPELPIPTNTASLAKTEPGPIEIKPFPISTGASWKVDVPTTLNFHDGDVVPMPTLLAKYASPVVVLFPEIVSPPVAVPSPIVDDAETTIPTVDVGASAPFTSDQLETPSPAPPPRPRVEVATHCVPAPFD